MTERNTWYKLSKLISVVMHPLLMTFYVMALFFYGNTVLVFAQTQPKLYFLGIILFNTVVVPLLFIGVMKGAGYYKRLGLQREQERVISLMVTAITYAICTYIVPEMFYVLAIKRLLLAATICIVFAAIVSWKWRINLHMIAVGAALTMIFLMHLSGIGELLIPLIILILLSGVLGSAQLYLKEADMVQLGVGLVSGIVITALVLV